MQTYLIPRLDFVDTPNLPDLFRTRRPSPDPLPRMNTLGARAFGTSAYRSMTFRGSGFEAILHQNGPDGGHWQSMVKRIADDIEKAVSIVLAHNRAVMKGDPETRLIATTHT